MRKDESSLPINFASKQRFLCPIVMHFLQHVPFCHAPASPVAGRQDARAAYPELQPGFWQKPFAVSG